MVFASLCYFGPPVGGSLPAPLFFRSETPGLPSKESLPHPHDTSTLGPPPRVRFFGLFLPLPWHVLFVSLASFSFRQRFWLFHYRLVVLFPDLPDRVSLQSRDSFLLRFLPPLTLTTRHLRQNFPLRVLLRLTSLVPLLFL